jgi:hypothetical protein
MKTKIKMMLVSMVISATAFAACAQDNDRNGPPPGGPGGGGPGGHRPPMPAIIKALDANHDGVIDADEIANASAVLKTLDKNGDGKLTTDEYLGKRPGPRRGGDDSDTNAPAADAPSSSNDRPHAGPGGPGGGHRHPPVPAIVKALDANHDGVIDADEIANASTVLKTLDKNGDGKLTHEEFMGKRPSPPRDDNGDHDAGGPPPNDDAPPMEQ